MTKNQSLFSANSSSSSIQNLPQQISSREKRKQEIVTKQLLRDILRTPILRLAKRREYIPILFVLRRPEIDVRQWLDVGPRCNNTTTNKTKSKLSIIRTKSNDIDHFKGQTILMQLMKYQPPVEVVDLICQRMTEYQTEWTNHHGSSLSPSMMKLNAVPEMDTDIQGKTPLHFAAEYGCSFDVVKRLLKGKNHSQPAFVQDTTFRFPLHWACISDIRKDDQSGATSRHWSSLLCSHTVNETMVDSNDPIKIIKLLLTIHPDAVIAREQNGRTPLFLAKQYGLSDAIIRLLEDAENAHSKTLKSYYAPSGTPNTSLTREISIPSVVDMNFSTSCRDDDYYDDDNNNNVTHGFPIHLVEEESDDDDYDDLSSIGTGGVSRCYVPHKPVEVVTNDGHHLVVL